ncbi:response regulator transcription factor [Terrabacter sp. BE26]|uniref:response regulator transcription factor n=1 Tax=Terrabacter sp. BE26 TaxID=2898152 RepID=UPI0035BE23A5
MDEQARWIRIAAEILNAPLPSIAHEVLVEGLMRQTHADLATRIGLTPQEPETLRISVEAREEVPPREHWPVARQARAHPLSQYYGTTHDRAPVRLTDLLAAGWGLDDDAREAAEALGITEHQLTLPCRPGGSDFDGWVVLNQDGFTDDDLSALTALQPLLVGLDRHVAMFAEIAALREGPAPDAVTLTPRESVVLRLMASGSTAEGIAARLAISPRTVHKHQEHLYRKLRASDRLSAVLAAQRLGLLPVGPLNR